MKPIAETSVEILINAIKLADADGVEEVSKISMFDLMSLVDMIYEQSEMYDEQSDDNNALFEENKKLIEENELLKYKLRMESISNTKANLALLESRRACSLDKYA